MVVIFTMPVNASSGATNTFNVRLSSNYAKVNGGNNNGATMISKRWDDKFGVIKLHCRFDFPYISAGFGDEITYNIPGAIKDGATIELSYGGRVVRAKMHTYNGGTRFGNITKIDGIGGGYYFRYN